MFILFCRCTLTLHFSSRIRINILILRKKQGRNLRHRMVARNVLVGDPCPWVAQSADAFLSKIFACSYSIAGIGVQNANPTDHLVREYQPIGFEYFL